MIKTYPVADAQGKFPGIISEVESGTTVHLTEEDGHTAVVMMSLAEYHRLAHGWQPAPKGGGFDINEIIRGFQEAYEIDGIDLGDVFDRIRDESNGRGMQS